MKRITFFKTWVLPGLVLLLLPAWLPQGGLRAQNPQASSKQTLGEVIKQIQTQTAYQFFYDDKLSSTEVEALQPDYKTQPIQRVLDKVLKGKDISYKIEDKIIYLSVKPNTPPPVPTQKRTVRGKITDENHEAVIGAVVKVQDSDIFAVSDLDGNYSLIVDDPEAVLEISVLGYRSKQEILNPGQTEANINLVSEAMQLEGIVVVGYGVQNKRDVTTSIASIKAQDFATSPTTDFRDAMAAKMPGVQVLSLGGQPDGNVSIRVRGIQSATAGNEPLYVIDGVPCDARAFANLESHDIESLEVLKDASASAIYGSRGSCGVILITTKRGSSDKMQISYDGYASVSTVSKKIEMLDAYEFATLFKEARDGAYLFDVPTGNVNDPYEIRPQTYHRVDPLITAYLMDTTGTLTNTDWQEEIFRPALSTKHALSISERGKNLSYYVGANYLLREGTILGSDFERYSLRANLNGQRGRLTYGLSFSPSYSKTHHVSADTQYGGDGVIASALMAPPIFPVYNADGSYNWQMNGYLRFNKWDTQTNEVLNPVALATEIDDKREKINVIGNAYIGYEFFKGLEYRLTAGGDFFTNIRNYYRPSYIPLRGQKYYDNASEPVAQVSNDTYFHWNIANQLSYNYRTETHSVSAVAVYEAEKQTLQASRIQGAGVAGDDKIRTTKGKTLDPENTYNNITAYTFASWLLRVQYAYSGRYMLSASIRGDGSSRFAPNTRWGYFPAASAGWRISDEAFMSGAKKWLDDMKLRVSVGKTGNAQIGNNEYLALYNTTVSDQGNGLTPIVYPAQIANNSLGWEKSTQYNIGTDISLWKGLLGITADAYYSRTTDMLFDVPVAAISGLTSSNVNIGSMQNKGLELSLTSRKTLRNFSYQLAANWTLNRNKVLSLGDENADIIKESSYAGGYYLTRVGHPVGCYYLLVQDGVFANQEELDAYPHFDTTVVGDFRFVDANQNGRLEKDNDRVIVGNYMPDFFYGFSFNLSYKDFDFAANLQGVYGNEILNLERRYLLNMEGSSNMMVESLERFPVGKLNRPTRKSSGNNGASTSTFHIEDGSYLRLQNLSLGYNIPNRLVRKAGISNLRFYLQANNLFTLTSYTGYNPEVNNHAADALRPGEDYCSYPLSRTFSIGLHFNL